MLGFGVIEDRGENDSKLYLTVGKLHKNYHKTSRRFFL